MAPLEVGCVYDYVVSKLVWYICAVWVGPRSSYGTLCAHLLLILRRCILSADLLEVTIGVQFARHRIKALHSFRQYVPENYTGAQCGEPYVGVWLRLDALSYQPGLGVLAGVRYRSAVSI